MGFSFRANILGCERCVDSCRGSITGCGFDLGDCASHLPIFCSFQFKRPLFEKWMVRTVEVELLRRWPASMFCPVVTLNPNSYKKGPLLGPVFVKSFASKALRQVVVTPRRIELRFRGWKPRVLTVRRWGHIDKIISNKHYMKYPIRCSKASPYIIKLRYSAE